MTDLDINSLRKSVDYTVSYMREAEKEKQLEIG